MPAYRGASSVPTINKDKRYMEDTILPIHKTSYLYEINKNNRNLVTSKKIVAPILSMFSTRARRIFFYIFS
jgi:hypothetical protein